MQLKNEIMLITYADSLGSNLKELGDILENDIKDAVGGVHILPFFPSSADRGFAPMRYDRVSPEFGNFADVERIGKSYYLMFDFMINHISRSSEFFRDFEKKKDQSEYRDLFIRYKDFWENGEPTAEQVDKIYKRKPRAPYTDVEFGDGSREKVWCTFCEEQIDLNVESAATKKFIRENLVSMCSHGASIIRLDAFAYAVKKPDTSCFFVKPDIWNLLRETEALVKPYGVEILPEIHEHYSIQMEIAGEKFWIYDFALPVLTLHALYSGKGKYLREWLLMSPMKQFTTLDTHDGIGIVDVKDLLPDEEIEFTKDKMFAEGANVKKIYNTEAYNNLDIYQVNTTYYAALGENDNAYLLARAIQFFAPGIPQVYYVGMLAGANDIALMESTKNGRDINRHCYSAEEVKEELKRPVIKDLLALMRFRNRHPAFSLEGQIEVALTGEHGLRITRKQGEHFAVLDADLKRHTFEIRCS
ncbi:sucrose phosphorylase [Blautia producta]|uniref:sucrose phosphorylase n=1 Tax=Blautia producta TaxID=33035 RepID=UPI001D07765B|nr:sucrose phosphorylase [Blautia producta]MCB6724401.1 sucrose phosphorylase [Blautia marasmi]MCQ5094080.1 sucrose phosphorylase [Blautia producta]